MKRKLLEERNKNARFVRASNRCGTHRNCVRVSTANSFKHELAKFLKCWELAQQNKEFLTEAIFEKNGRADIFVLDDNEAIEIVETEKQKNLNKKKQKYPCKLKIVNALNVLEEHRCGRE